MRRVLAVAVLLVSCGGSSPNEWAGSWRSAPAVQGSYVTMTLAGTGTSITGAGVQHVEAGQDQSFTVSGTSARPPGLTFTYADGATEVFSISQPDASHLVLSNPDRMLNFTRQ